MPLYMTHIFDESWGTSVPAGQLEIATPNYADAKAYTIAQVQAYADELRREPMVRDLKVVTLKDRDSHGRPAYDIGITFWVAEVPEAIEKDSLHMAEVFSLRNVARPAQKES